MGLEHADSFTWDAHKVMNIPLICSVILVKQAGTLHHNIVGANTDYLYHSNSVEEDLGEKSIQCGRRADAVKLWFSWKCYGKEGYAKRVENLMAMATHAEEIVKQTPKLELLVPRQSLNICFRYVPKVNVDLNKFNLTIRENLRKSGESIVNYGYIGETLAIRLVVSNGDMQKEDVEQFFQNFMSIANQVESNINE
jgi:glutamate/tyrosine decarboxylase-like PLP-dependent enzyme